MKKEKLVVLSIVALLTQTLLNGPIALAESISELSDRTNRSSESTPTENQSEEMLTVEQETTESLPDQLLEPVGDETHTPSPLLESSQTVTEKENTNGPKDKVIPPEEGDVVINVLPTKSIPIGSRFDIMEGVSAYDHVNNLNVTSQINYTIQYQDATTGAIYPVTTVDTTIEGSYWINYTVSTPNGSASVYRWVMVIPEDTGIYSIELYDFKLPKNADYIAAIENNIVIRDGNGHIIPTTDAEVHISGIHSTSETGIINVEVAVVNSIDYTVTTTTVNITIVDPINFILQGEDQLTVAYGTIFDPTPWAHAFGLDAYGEQIDVPVTIISNNLDTTKPGNYEIIYRATDEFGNTGTVTYYITVAEPNYENPLIKAENKKFECW